MITIVIDNNVFVSAMLRGGNPKAVLDAVGQGRVALITTSSIMEELREVLLRPKFKPHFETQDLDIEKTLLDYEKLARHVSPTTSEVALLRDDKDLRFLECAVGGGANYLVSGDKDLTTLERYKEVMIVTPAQFLAFLNEPEDGQA